MDMAKSAIGSFQNPICHASTSNTEADRWYYENGEVYIWSATKPSEVITRPSYRDWFRITDRKNARLTKWVSATIP